MFPQTRGEEFVSFADSLGSEFAKRFDCFDLIQLREVVKVCRASRSLADAGKSCSPSPARRRTHITSFERNTRAFIAFQAKRHQISKKNMKNATLHCKDRLKTTL